MERNSRIINDCERLKRHLNPRYVTVTEVPDPASEGMAHILRLHVHHIRSMGTTDLHDAPVPVQEYCFYVYFPRDYPDSRIQIKFDKFDRSNTREKAIFPYTLNVFEDGSWCYGQWSKDIQLHLVIRKVLRAIVFDPDPLIINFDSKANSLTEDWIRTNWNQFPYFPSELLFNHSAPVTSPGRTSGSALLSPIVRG